jgi:hypothetical protein
MKKVIFIFLIVFGYRSEAENGNYIKINTALIPAKGS